MLSELIAKHAYGLARIETMAVHAPALAALVTSIAPELPKAFIFWDQTRSPYKFCRPLPHQWRRVRCPDSNHYNWVTEIQGVTVELTGAERVPAHESSPVDLSNEPQLP
jgi:hypothetical protein